jgi:hypothetical protein
MGSGEMTNEEIFELAETYGEWDDFGRWTFRDNDGLLRFVDSIVRTHTPEDIKKIERKWVSLTDAEMCECYNSKSIGYAIEAKLKEKNNG